MTPGGSSNDASHGTAECQAGNGVFTTSPLSLSNVIGWVPLGAIEPPGHTFPTDHQYLYYANPGSPGNTTLNVVAPSNLRIWMIYQTTGLKPSTPSGCSPARRSSAARKHHAVSRATSRRRRADQPKLSRPPARPTSESQCQKS